MIWGDLGSLPAGTYSLPGPVSPPVPAAALITHGFQGWAGVRGGASWPDDSTMALLLMDPSVRANKGRTRHSLLPTGTCRGQPETPSPSLRWTSNTDGGPSLS